MIDVLALLIFGYSFAFYVCTGMGREGGEEERGERGREERE